MSLPNCNAFMNRLNTLVFACNDSITTRYDLETIIAGLDLCNDDIVNDVATMPIIMDMAHLDLFIQVSHQRHDKCAIERCLKKLVKLRQEAATRMMTTPGFVMGSLKMYELETALIEEYRELLFPSI